MIKFNQSGTALNTDFYEFNAKEVRERDFTGTFSRI